MSFKTLSQSLINSVSQTVKTRNSEKVELEQRLFAQGLRKFGVKKVSQLTESDHKALYAWVQTKLYEACSCDAYEDHMPGDDVLYNTQGKMKKALDEQDASDVVKAELEKMGKTLGELSPEEKKDLFNKVDSQVKAKNEEAGKDYDGDGEVESSEDEYLGSKDAAIKNAMSVSESIAFEPDEIATNKAVAVGSAMGADPIAADVIRDVVTTQGKVEYRLLLQYATGGEIFLGAPYEGTHIYPPTSMPGASSIEMLRDMIEAMPFYNKVVENALEKAITPPSTDPMFMGNDKKITESKNTSKKKSKRIISEEISSDNLPELYLDMDGTIVDWESGANAALQDAGKPEWNDPYWEETYGNKEDDRQKWAILNATPNFWESLKFTDDGKKIWNFVKKYRPHILSACGVLTKNCKRGKINWINRYLEPKKYIGKIHLVNRKDKKKFAVDANDKPTVLIDDYIKNCQEYKSAGGIAVQVTTANEVIAKLRKLGFK
jgi:hypothetical protein